MLLDRVADRVEGRCSRRGAALAEPGEELARLLGLEVDELDRRGVRGGEAREPLDAARVLVDDVDVREDLRAGIG